MLRSAGTAIFSALRLLQPDGYYPRVGTGDDATAIQVQADLIKASGLRGKIILGNRTWVCSKTISLDPHFAVLQGTGACLDFSAATTGLTTSISQVTLPTCIAAAATSAGNAAPANKAGPEAMSGFLLKVPTNTIGITLAAAVATDGFNSSYSFRNVQIDGGANSIVVGKNSYLQNAFACSFGSTTAACIYRTGETNSGENFNFHGCTFYNSDHFIRDTGPNCDFYFFGCSFDYWSNYITYTQSGQFEFHGCHVEGNYIAGASPFILDSAAQIKIYGGNIGIGGTAPAYLFNMGSNKGEVFMSGVTGTPSFTTAITNYMPGFFSTKPLNIWTGNTLATTGTLTVNPFQNDTFTTTLTGNLVVANPIVACGQGNTLIFTLIQAASGGPYTATFGTQFVFPLGAAPVMPTAAGATLVVRATWDAVAGLYNCTFTGSQKVNAQTGTAYTLTAADHDCDVVLTNAAAITLTVPSTLPAGFSCGITQGGAGQVTVAGGTGMTLANRSGQSKLAGQNGQGSLFVPVAGSVVLSGDTA